MTGLVEGTDRRTAAAPGLEVETIASLPEFEALAPAWDALVASSRRSSPFLLQGWLVPWWRQFGAGRELAVQVARRDGRLVGALPFFVERRLGLSVARFVGGELSEIADLLLAPGEDPATARLLADRVDADVIHVFGLPAQSVLAEAVSPDPVRSAVRAEAPRMHATGTWEEIYRSKLSKDRRRLRRKRLERLAARGEVEFVVASDGDALAEALEDAFGIHRRRWEGLPDRSGFVTPEGQEFHRDAIRALAEAGIPRIVSLRVGGRPIAYYYYLQLGDRVCGADMSYDTEFGPYSPGWLTVVQMLEVAVGEGAREIEFLGSNEPYKLTFADELAPLHEALIRPRGLRAHIYVDGRLAALALRARLKRSDAVRHAYYERLAPIRRLIARRG
jgi:CelD/BcsL family acetyltransferase involved in cellulose biosynthesis